MLRGQVNDLLTGEQRSTRAIRAAVERLLGEKEAEGTGSCRASAERH
jgi:hypothetical protein